MSEPDAPLRKPWSPTDRVLLGSIVLMTVLILVGLVAVVVRIVTGPGGTASAPTPIGIAGDINALGLDGDRLAVHVREPGGEAIVIYDLSRGMEEARIPVNRLAD